MKIFADKMQKVLRFLSVGKSRSQQALVSMARMLPRQEDSVSSVNPDHDTERNTR